MAAGHVDARCGSQREVVQGLRPWTSPTLHRKMTMEVGVTEFVTVVVLAIVFLGVAVVGIAAYVAIRRTKARSARPSSVGDDSIRSGHREITLPVDDADPANAATMRLVQEAARRALAADPTVMTVVVTSTSGRELGRVERAVAVPPAPLVDVPLAISEPHAPRHYRPDDAITSQERPHTPPGVRFTEEPPRPHRTLAEHFELPDVVRDRIHDPEDAVDIVCATLDAAGVPTHVDGNVVRFDDNVIVVLRAPLWSSVTAERLNVAFLLFQRSGARSGVVVTPGALHVHDVRRREMLAPELLHTGPEGIQRMADAVAMGADPRHFIVPTW